MLFCTIKIALSESTTRKERLIVIATNISCMHVDLHVTCVTVLPSLRPHGLAPRDKHLSGAGRGGFEFENMMICGCGDYGCLCSLTHLAFVLARAHPLTQFRPPSTLTNIYPHKHLPTNPQRVPSHKDNFSDMARSQ